MTGNLDQPEGSLGDPQWYRSRARPMTGNAPVREFAAMDNAAWIISSRLIAGLILYTGFGFVLSLWLGHRSLFMAVGALIGLGLSYYLIFTGLSRENKVIEQSKMGPMGSTIEGDR
jgi:F0F1-type ATP synthase assembly protein I